MSDDEQFNIGISSTIKAYKSVCEYNRELHKDLDKMRAENARLRELVLEIWRSCPVDKFDCARCPHCLGESSEVWCELQTLMCELGVEVDG